MTPVQNHQLRLLDGTRGLQGPESLVDHLARVGTRPRGRPDLIDVLRRAGLEGRGGAGFPAHIKWQSVRDNGGGDTRVVVNASEGEPLSGKDQCLLRRRPHLVLDGAVIAAETVGARRVDVYVSRPYRREYEALKHAVAERRNAGSADVEIRLKQSPHRYVAGEASSVVRFLNGGPSKPWNLAPRPHVSGVDGRPTLIQNTETMAHVALIARHGAEWFREAGTATSPGTTLLTVSGAVRRPGVVEVAYGTTVSDAIEMVGGLSTPPSAILLGGFFGTWLTAAEGLSVALETTALATLDGASIGCGVVMVLPQQTCGIDYTAKVIRYLADESAGQCGPCVNGLAAVANTVEEIAAAEVDAGARDRLTRWCAQIAQRGACHHPDGAIRHLRSALRVFSDDLERHMEGRGCIQASGAASVPPFARGKGWR